MMSRKSQQGVVIIMALFIVALVAALSYVMMARLDRDTTRTRLLLRDTQAEFYAQGSLQWAINQLQDNVEKQKPDQLTDVLPIKSPVNEVNGYKISGVIDDMQSRFNLNNLSSPDAQPEFVRLLQAVDPSLQTTKAQDIARAVTEWVTPVSQQNEFTKYYLEQQQPPYSPGHRLMASASELQLVKGMTPALYHLLQPYITALPVVTPVNVQDADAPVLVSLSAGMTMETADALVQARAQSPITSTQSFQALDLIKNHPVPTEKTITVSSYFLLETTVTVEKQKLVLYSLLERAVSSNKSAIKVLWQSKSQPG